MAEVGLHEVRRRRYGGENIAERVVLRVGQQVVEVRQYAGRQRRELPSVPVIAVAVRQGRMTRSTVGAVVKGLLRHGRRRDAGRNAGDRLMQVPVKLSGSFRFADESGALRESVRHARIRDLQVVELTGAIRRGERVDPTVGTLVGEAALICGGVGDAVQSAVPVPAKGRFAPVGIVNFGYLPGLLGGAGLIKKRVGAAVGVNDIFDAKCVVYVVRVGRIYK